MPDSAVDERPRRRSRRGRTIAVTAVVLVVLTAGGAAAATMLGLDPRDVLGNRPGSEPTSALPANTTEVTRQTLTDSESYDGQLGYGSATTASSRFSGTLTRLSRKELAVLAELLRADGAVVSSEQLLEKAWDEHADPFTGAVRLTVLKLRRKLGDPPVVETVTGTGYRIR